MSLKAGSRLGPYEVLAPLGAGGMGEVYRARDSKLKREVAIKVLPQSLAGDPEALARFEREALAVAALSHPNILAIFDFGTHEGIFYAVMELLEGETLRGKLDTGPITQKQAVEYAQQIVKGLSAAVGLPSAIRGGNPSEKVGSPYPLLSLGGVVRWSPSTSVQRLMGTLWGPTVRRGGRIEVRSGRSINVWTPLPCVPAKSALSEAARMTPPSTNRF